MTDISATYLTSGEMNVDNYELDITDGTQGLTAQQRKFEAKLGVPLHADASTWAQDILPEYDKGAIQGATDEETDNQVDLKPGLRLRPEFKEDDQSLDAEDGIEHDSSDDTYPQSEEPGLYQDGATCDMQEQLMQTGAAQTQHFWDAE